ncbi:putative hydrolase [Gordonia araii NBRC 100433]|uniref:Putative hydrolase n=1 Tax=Gordonia araii NBRC 100433 TaxID=1073574 RepID=G7H639_9ACTN|nr:alpha/beta hydrolase [Gordonia araii]NNG98723.1 alpha/beta hydrolase [Gordonia araii NBRC 100433]GAB11278.1 putative hydrolase [Gordonia araii NBRC 100433]
MTTIETSAGRAAYDSRGSGPPLVLLHATLHDRHDFDQIVGPLAADYRVITVDWPGHGDAGPAAGVTAPSLAKALDEIVTALDIGPAVFIGNSVGGYAAARLAIERPDAVAGLVLVNTGGFSPQDRLSNLVCRLLGSPAIASRLAPAVVSSYMRAASDEDRAIASRALSRIRTDAGLETFTSLWRSFADPEHDLRRRAGTITAPTLVVWGTRDRVAAARWGRTATRVIPGAEFVALPTGHIVFASAPSAFLERVRPFIAAAHARIATRDKAPGV